MRRLLSAVALAGAAALASAASYPREMGGRPLYLDPNSPVDDRVDDLVSRMTLCAMLRGRGGILHSRGCVRLVGRMTPRDSYYASRPPLSRTSLAFNNNPPFQRGEGRADA
jgi:hypothetical protein